jgi:NADH-quinone oxidoreductase subunit J
MGVRVDQLDQPDLVLRRGMSGHLLAFEIISIHLVVVLVGAAYLARAKRTRPPHLKHSDESPD